MVTLATQAKGGRFISDSRPCLLHGRRTILRVDQRIATKIPLAELWGENGTIAGERIANLDENTVLALIRPGSLQLLLLPEEG